MHFVSCPHCGRVGTLHRSRSRNFREKLIKFLLPYKTYRCKECGWRGFIWIGFKEKFFGSGERRKKVAKWQIYSFFFVLAVLIILAYLFFEKIGTNLAPVVQELLKK